MSANAASSTPTEVLGKNSLSLIDAQRGSDWCAPEASEHVGQFLLYGRSGTMADLSAALRVDLDARHEAWLRDQYLRDLDVIERCECRGQKGGCADFFGCMGTVAAARGGDAA